MSEQSTCIINSVQELFPSLIGENSNGNIKRINVDNQIIIRAKDNQLLVFYPSISEYRKIPITGPIVLARPIATDNIDKSVCDENTTFIERNIFVSLIGGKKAQLPLGTIFFAKDGKVNIVRGYLADVVLVDDDLALIEKAKHIISNVQVSSISLRGKQLVVKTSITNVETVDEVSLAPNIPEN
jgi:hypothetical protein